MVFVIGIGKNLSSFPATSMRISQSVTLCFNTICYVVSGNSTRKNVRNSAVPNSRTPYAIKFLKKFNNLKKSEKPLFFGLFSFCRKNILWIFCKTPEAYGWNLVYTVKALFIRPIAKIKIFENFSKKLPFLYLPIGYQVRALFTHSILEKQKSFSFRVVGCRKKLLLYKWGIFCETPH